MLLRDWLRPILHEAEAPPEKSLAQILIKELSKNKMVVILNHYMLPYRWTCRSFPQLLAMSSKWASHEARLKKRQPEHQWITLEQAINCNKISIFALTKTLQMIFWLNDQIQVKTCKNSQEPIVENSKAVRKLWRLKNSTCFSCWWNVRQHCPCVVIEDRNVSNSWIQLWVFASRILTVLTDFI